MNERPAHPDHGTDPSCSCTPRSGLSRRGFLGALGVGALAAVAGPGLTRTAFASAATPPGGDTLIVLDLRGGMDGLSLVAPIGDPNYSLLRPSIAIPASTGIATGDAMFALHPAMAPLLPFWRAGTAGALHAIAQPDESRSHFESQFELDRAAPQSNVLTGWLDRAVSALGTSGAMQVVTMGSGVADGLLAGPAPVFATSALKDFSLYNSTNNPALATAIARLHAISPLPWASVATTTLGAVATAASVVSTEATPANGAVYPDGPLGDALADVARLIRANVGLRFASVDMGNWDMHVNLGSSGTGWMADQAGELASALAAFATDIGPTALATTSLITVSEFGRRAGENGSGGVDHGHGNAMLFLGGGLRGGQVLGRWPTLAPDALDQGDLAGTTDYRDVFADLLTVRCGLPVSALASVFPGYQPVGTGIARTG